jgi:hypothetical protein
MEFGNEGFFLNIKFHQNYNIYSPIILKFQQKSYEFFC